MKGKILSIALVMAMVASLFQPWGGTVYADANDPVTYDIGDGSIRLTTSGSSILVQQGTTTSQQSITVPVKITGSSTSAGIEVAADSDGIGIVFDNLNIDRSNSTEAAVTLEAGSGATISLTGSSVVKGGAGMPGIKVEGGIESNSTSLTIKNIGEGNTGSLNATGGIGAPGIGNTGGAGDDMIYSSVSIESGQLIVSGGADQSVPDSVKAAPAIGSVTTATSIKIGSSAQVRAYSTGTLPAIYGTGAEGTQAIVNLSFDASDSYTTGKLTTQTAITMPAQNQPGEQTIGGITLSPGYRAFAATVNGSYSYYAEARVGTPTAIKYDIVSAADGAWTFTSQSDGSYTSSSAIKFKQSGGGGGGGNSGGSSKPVLNKKDHVKYMDAYANSYFKPDQAITRGEVAGAFARLMDKPINTKKTYKNSFSDVDSDNIYSNHIGFLEQYDILKGYPDGTFRPENPITRAEFAAVASRFDDLEETNKNVFSDIDENNMWAVKAINSAYKKGWIDGYPNGKFKPSNNITRAEVVKIVSSMLDRTIDADSIKGHKITTFKDLDDEHWAYYFIIEATHDHEYTIKNKKEVWSK